MFFAPDFKTLSLRVLTLESSRSQETTYLKISLAWRDLLPGAEVQSRQVRSWGAGRWEERKKTGRQLLESWTMMSMFLTKVVSRSWVFESVW